MFLGKKQGNAIGSLGEKALIDLAVSLPNDVFHKLATKTTLSILDKFERKISRQRSDRSRKRM